MQSKQKYNVIFIMTDQQRADSIERAQRLGVELVNMRRLGEESVNFNSFYCAAQPCVPSRACFLTGRHNWQNRTMGNVKFIMDDQETWMSVLRKHNYRCVSVGKTHKVRLMQMMLQVRMEDDYHDGQASSDEIRLWDEIKASKEPEIESNPTQRKLH